MEGRSSPWASQHVTNSPNVADASLAALAASPVNAAHRVFLQIKRRAFFFFFFFFRGGCGGGGGLQRYLTPLTYHNQHRWLSFLVRWIAWSTLIRAVLLLLQETLYCKQTTVWTKPTKQKRVTLWPRGSYDHGRYPLWFDFSYALQLYQHEWKQVFPTPLSLSLASISIFYPTPPHHVASMMIGDNNNNNGASCGRGCVQLMWV